MEKIAQSLWIGELTPVQRLSIASFLANGYDYFLYCYKAPAGVPDRCKIKDANEILPENKIFAYRNTFGCETGSFAPFSDLFRYKLLFERGGWWVDTDVVCLKAFDFEGDFIAAYQDSKYITNTVIRSKINHKLARVLFNEASKHGPDAYWGCTGPALLTRIIRRYRMAFWYNIRILQPEVFYPIHYSQWHKIIEDNIIPPNSYAIHLWFEMWRRCRVDFDTIPENSLYNRLVERYRDFLR